MFTKFSVSRKKVIGSQGNHLKLIVKGTSFEMKDMVMFDCAEDIEKLKVDDLIDVAGYVDINNWNNNMNIQFQVKEWSYSAKVS